MAINDRNNFGLTERDMQTLRDIINKYPEVQDIFIFGSRAKGNFTQGSDIDLAIMNEGVTDKVIAQLKSALEESTLPYFVDVTNYHTLQHAELKSHIDRVGMPLYQRKK